MTGLGGSRAGEAGPSRPDGDPSPSGRQVILFDVMGTLVHDPFFEEVPKFFDLSLADLVAVKHPTAWIEFEHGRMLEADYLRTFFADGRAFDGEGLKACMRAAYRWLDGVEPLLAELASAGVEMHTLSNYPCWYALIEERLALSRYLPWTFVSCATGHRKPSRAAYLEAARKLDRRPEECLFVDDRKINCDAAEALGMPSILFGDAVALRRDLTARGLLQP